MGDCGTCGPAGAGPFSLGRDLVEFVYRAHGGAVAVAPIPGGGINTTCQGCGERFVMRTFVSRCPKCGGVHAVSPPRAQDPDGVQFAGVGYTLPE
jgi:hypothetical protein